jgi:hypothetical protein
MVSKHNPNRQIAAIKEVLAAYRAHCDLQRSNQKNILATIEQLAALTKAHLEKDLVQIRALVNEHIHHQVFADFVSSLRVGADILEIVRQDEDENECSDLLHYCLNNIPSAQSPGRTMASVFLADILGRAESNARADIPPRATFTREVVLPRRQNRDFLGGKVYPRIDLLHISERCVVGIETKVRSREHEFQIINYKIGLNNLEGILTQDCVRVIALLSPYPDEQFDIKVPDKKTEKYVFEANETVKHLSISFFELWRFLMTEAALQTEPVWRVLLFISGNTLLRLSNFQQLGQVLSSHSGHSDINVHRNSGLVAQASNVIQEFLQIVKGHTHA